MFFFRTDAIAALLGVFRWVPFMEWAYNGPQEAKQAKIVTFALMLSNASPNSHSATR